MENLYDWFISQRPSGIVAAFVSDVSLIASEHPSRYTAWTISRSTGGSAEEKPILSFGSGRRSMLRDR